MATKQHDGKALTVEEVLQQNGQFKGAEGLRGLYRSDEFWEGQMYGTRLYYGDGYLHRSVLGTTIKVIESLAAQLAERDKQIARLESLIAFCNEKCMGVADVAEDRTDD